jgi:hypothetical protein
MYFLGDFHIWWKDLCDNFPRCIVSEMILLEDFAGVELLDVEDIDLTSLLIYGV